MEALRSAILTVADQIRDAGTVTLRQLYYALTVRGVLEKTEAAYKRLAQITSVMRRGGAMPYDWIEDSTRVTWAPSTWSSARHALENLAEQYAESPWPGAEIVPEIWLEKDALSGPVYDVTHALYAPLRVQRGYASLSALYRAAKDIHARYVHYGSRTVVYYLRDLDPSGADAARAAEATVAEMLAGICWNEESGARMSGAVDCLPEFRILGVTPDQVREWSLPSRPNKAADSRTARFSHSASVELDAIPPAELRRLVENAITSHISDVELRIHEAGVDSTRSYLRGLAEAAS